MNFFKLYIGDYQRDTAHLSIAEHGAYLLMLQHYYATEKPLPVGKALHRMLRAQDKTERDAIDAVSAQFWVESDAGLDNLRATEEIRKAIHQRTINKEIGKLGGRPKRNELETESVSESVSESEPIDNPNHSQTPKKEKKQPLPTAADAACVGLMPRDAGTNPRVLGTNPRSMTAEKAEHMDRFDRFWSAYPRKVAKPSALKAWMRLAPNAELSDVILRAIRIQRENVSWTKDGGQFIPHPATWLNGRRWEDETGRSIAPTGVFSGVRVDNMEPA